MEAPFSARLCNSTFDCRLLVVIRSAVNGSTVVRRAPLHPACHANRTEPPPLFHLRTNTQAASIGRAWPIHGLLTRSAVESDVLLVRAFVGARASVIHPPAFKKIASPCHKTGV
jgi:hypothetical protein